MVAVAQLVEPLTVTQVVVGSSPIGHPIYLVYLQNKKKAQHCGAFFVVIKCKNTTRQTQYSAFILFPANTTGRNSQQ